MRRLILLTAAGLLFSGCLRFPIHQGNVLKPELVFAIHEGDSRFRVESLLGTPVMRDVFHPNRALYVEDYVDPKTGKAYRRIVDIRYDQAQRVARILRKGFEKVN